MIITIDGPIATGKSSIAKALAKEVGYIYFDTGAMYRCVTYGIMKEKVNADNPQELLDFLQRFSFDIKIKQGDKHYFVDNEDVTLKIRNEEVTKNVSKISAIHAVREKLVAIQRQHAEGVNAVFEGRDMGTVVFPQAQLKIFLTGRPEVRAKRRFDELRAKFPTETENLSLEQTLQEIAQRDQYDMNREISPLRKAPDALEIDTSDHTLQEIVLQILEYRDSIKTRHPGKG
ncbi:MAG: (d)CMP kinase [Parachlamydia sp.]|nr:(d)CMP kinase [Parachlamydia sp.]